MIEINVVGFVNKRKPGGRKVKKNQVAPLIQTNGSKIKFIAKLRL
jgi:hypothetical protein